MGPAAAAAFLLLFGIGAPAVPRQLECPPPLVSYERTDRLALHPDPGIVYHGQHCRRADGVPEGPTVAWGADRQKLSMIGSYCGGHAQGRWSFFWGNGVLAREGSFQGASLRNGAWADYDTSGRKLVEIVYAEGREIARQEYPRSLSELPIDPEATDRLSVERYEAVLRQRCTAVAPPLRPYHGLRAELRGADAVVVVRATSIQVDRPPAWVEGLPLLPQRIEGTVKRVLAGFLGRPGARIQLSFSQAEHWKRVETLMGTPEYRLGVNLDGDVTVLVKRNGERLEVLNLLAANESERTDEFFTEYARLAALDDRAFRLGLARHIADRVRLAPDRLLWVRWMVLALDDWDRLPRPSPTDNPGLQQIVRPTLAAILAQIDGFARGGNGGVNLFELPWLIRLLTEPQRRQLVAALLRMHPILLREGEEARTGRGPDSAADPEMELTLEDIRAMSAAATMSHLMTCLAYCVNPENPSPYAPDVLERARAFAR